MDTSLHQSMFAEYEQMAEDVRAIRTRIDAVLATADSDDRLVSATVGGRGELVELWLDPRVYRAGDSVALARAITETIHRAAELAQEEGFAIAVSLLPPGATAATADLRFDPFLHGLDQQVAGGEPR